MIRHLIIGTFMVLLGFGASVALAEEKPKQTQDKIRLQQRIDFGNSYIMGQSIKSGAVYLLHRKKSEIDSMISIRTDYRKEIMEEHSMPKIEKNSADDGQGKRTVAPAGFKASLKMGQTVAKKK